MMSWPHTGHGPRLARGIRTSLSFVSSSPTVSSVNLTMSPMNALRESSPGLDLRQPVLPLAGQAGRGQRVLAEQPDHVQTLLRDDERAAVALDVADLEQPLDDRRAGRRGPDPGSFIASRSSSSSTSLPAVSIAPSSERVAVAPRRLGLLRLRGDLRPSRRSPCSSRGSRCSRPSSSSDRSLRVGGLAVHAAPARDEDHASRASGTRDAPRSSRRACSRTRRRGGRPPGTAGRRGRRSSGRRRTSCRPGDARRWSG